MVLPKYFSNSTPIRFGYLPLVDCAPIAVAQETGIFDRHGLSVQLCRELGWAGIRDKMIYGHLDAAQSLAGIAVALALGFNGMRCEVTVPMILNLHGNAITLSTALSEEKIGRGEGLKNWLTYHWKKDRPLTLAVTHRYSSHFSLLKAWLNRHDITFPRDVEIIFLPPSLMPRHLRAGHIDGYCVGEPWNSEAVLAGTGWCPVTSAQISRGHPEKVLILSSRFLQEERDKAITLVSALIEACKLCQSTEFREDLIAILSLNTYTAASPEVLRNSLGATFDSGVDRISAAGFHVFHGDSINRPSMDKASWVLAEMRKAGTIPNETCGALSRVFREDLYHAAELCMTGI